ncbi:hypothetical protein [Arenibacter algicola]|uniref:Uncharacterized protein n=1 Tax=Arenibacter algicola TaxID=616991 RepID=A0A221UTS5_9FLAO|nr:hypothetical protein [Arenibacter algicola]ASO04598.1 hypothetical protein AREALGSMS7_01123 [Arenibacter algicola]
MTNINYLVWFTNELEVLFHAYINSNGDEKEGRKQGIKNFLLAQQKEFEKLIAIKNFNDAVGSPFSWNNLIEPYFFDNDLKAFLMQLKSRKLTPTVEFVPFPSISKENEEYCKEALEILDRLTEEIKSKLIGVEGYIRFQLCIPHKMIEPVEINGELTDVWPKFVKQDLSQEIVDWLA